MVKRRSKVVKSGQILSKGGQKLSNRVPRPLVRIRPGTGPGPGPGVGPAADPSQIRVSAGRGWSKLACGGGGENLPSRLGPRKSASESAPERRPSARRALRRPLPAPAPLAPGESESRGRAASRGGFGARSVDNGQKGCRVVVKCWATDLGSGRRIRSPEKRHGAGRRGGAGGAGLDRAFIGWTEHIKALPSFGPLLGGRGLRWGQGGGGGRGAGRGELQVAGKSGRDPSRILTHQSESDAASDSDDTESDLTRTMSDLTRTILTRI